MRMPVYLITIHAYRSWSEADPRGYVQRGEGLKPTQPRLARHRADAARFDPVRFEMAEQQLIREQTETQCDECGWRLHACATTPTHAHLLVSFREPLCECETLRHCHAHCTAHREARRRMSTIKRRLGLSLAKSRGTSGRPYWSRGMDVTPVRNPEHFDHLCRAYLPRHETTEAGTFRRYT